MCTKLDVNEVLNDEFDSDNMNKFTIITILTAYMAEEVQRISNSCNMCGSTRSMITLFYRIMNNVGAGLNTDDEYHGLSKIQYYQSRIKLSSEFNQLIETFLQLSDIELIFEINECSTNRPKFKEIKSDFKTRFPKIKFIGRKS